MQRRLPPFLATHFLSDFASDVPHEIWQSQKDANKRILNNRARFPRADFPYIERLDKEMEKFDAAAS